MGDEIGKQCSTNGSGERRTFLSVIVAFAVFIVVVMNSTICWDTTLCSPLTVNERYGEHVASIFWVQQA
jgi:hypothetical protein